MLLGCFVVTVGNLMSALPLALQHRMTLLITFIQLSPSNERYTDMWIIFKQQTAVCEEARVNTVFLRRTLHYTAECVEQSVGNILLREDGLLTGLVNKCEVLKVFSDKLSCR